jgi:single-strand DNA-binding protein
LINKVILLGHLGGDPELRYTQTGKPVCKFSLATARRWKDAQGNPQEKTAWHRLVAWGKLAEICSQYLTKGKQIYAEGELDYGSYEKDGVKHYTTDIIIHEMKMLGGRGAGDRASSQDPEYTPPGPDSDIPF